MPKFLQPSLSGGEMTPGMRGRVDLVRYTISLGKARNFITKPTGGGAKRPGTLFRGRVKYADRTTRIESFVYSSDVKYLIEMGDLYFRFWVDGALLTEGTAQDVEGISNSPTAVVTSTAHGFVDGDAVVITGVLGLTKANNRSFIVSGATTDTFELTGFDSSGLAFYASGGSISKVVEVETPYTEDQIATVRFTQSADVMYLTHGSVPTKELRRLTVNSFELRDFVFKRGPFKSFNTDEALIMAASGVTGIVTVTTNVDTFTDEMIGSLLVMEEKELRGVKPWASAEKNVPLGALRRSDSKVYRASGIPTSLGSAGTPYYVSGGVRPVHETGRAFDGPQDVKFDGVNDYAVGVEWEFLHNTFGIAQITAYTNERSVTAVVLERLPDSIVGVAPSPDNTWTFSGDGIETVFDIPGAISNSTLNYTVTIDGVPIQPNPYYGGGGETCVCVDAVLPGGRIAGHVAVDDIIALFDPNEMEHSQGAVTYSEAFEADLWRVETASGACLTCSSTAPIPTRNAMLVCPPDLIGHEVAVMRGNVVRWSMVVDCVPVGRGMVQHITVGDRCFWAGDAGTGFLLHHNAKPIGV